MISQGWHDSFTYIYVSAAFLQAYKSTTKRKGLHMNRAIYKATRRSIRDNGLRYTAHNAINTDDTDTLLTCYEIADVMRETDWLALRVNMQRRGENKAIAFKLTTKLLEK